MESDNKKKGDIGEDIVVKRMRQLGYFAFKCVNPGGHPCDYIFLKPDQAKIFFGDCKAYEKRIVAPDNSLDTPDFEKYQKLKEIYGYAFWIFFVDWKRASIYGGELGDISKESKMNGKIYPLKDERINRTYFPLTFMKEFFTLTEYEIYQLKKYTRESEQNRKLKGLS